MPLQEILTPEQLNIKSSGLKEVTLEDFNLPEEEPFTFGGAGKHALSKVMTLNKALGTGLKFISTHLQTEEYQHPSMETPEEQERVDALITKNIAENKINAEALWNMGEDVNKSAKEAQAMLAWKHIKRGIVDNPELLYDPKWLTDSFSEATVSQIPVLAAGLAAGPVAAGILGGFLEMTNTFEEALAKGATPKEAASAARQMWIISGVLNTVSSKVTLSNIPISPIAHLSEKAINIAKKAAFSGVVEATTEYLEEPSEALILHNKKLITWDELKERTKQGVDVIPSSFVMGAAGAGYAEMATNPSLGDYPVNLLLK